MSNAREVDIAEIKIGKRHRKDLGDIESLAQSMMTLGLLHPIGITADNELLFGQRRLKAARKLGWDTILAHVVEVDRLLAERDENQARKDFTPSERVSIAEAITLRVGERRGRPKKNTEDPGEIPKGVETAEHVAKVAGFGNDTTYRQAARVVAKGCAALREAMDEGVIAIEVADQIARTYSEDQQREIVRRVRAARVGKRNPDKVNARQVVRSLKRESALTRIESEPQPLPDGPFRVIVADPPWAYEKRKDDGTSRNQLSYPTMTTEEIGKLEIGALAHEDCVLWLWTTNAFMRDAFDVLDEWGFEEKTILTWAKDRMGTGDWLRGITEHCILAVRGKPMINLSNETTLLTAARREQSRKPEEFYALVEKLCPGSKLELFAREARAGWIAWGAEKEKFSGGQQALPPAEAASTSNGGDHGE